MRKALPRPSPIICHRFATAGDVLMRDDRPRYQRNILKIIGLAIALLTASCAPAQDKGFQDVLGLPGQGAGSRNPVEFSVSLAPGAQSGEVILRISAKISPDHYIY